MRIVLARHAQSEWQTDRSSGDWNSPLTRVGHEQARRLASAVAAGIELERGHRLEIGSLSASPFERAAQTASYVAAATGLVSTPVTELGEADFHVAAELPSRDTPFGVDVTGPTARYRRFQQQAADALRILVTHAGDGGATLAVTHGGLIKTLLRTVAASDAICFRLYNACLTLLEWRRGRWHLVYLNLWDHLAADLRTE